MTIASGMPTPFMSFETTDSQGFLGLPGGLFYCDGVGTARAGPILPRDQTGPSAASVILIIEDRGNWFVLRRTSSFVTNHSMLCHRFFSGTTDPGHQSSSTPLPSRIMFHCYVKRSTRCMHCTASALSPKVAAGPHILVKLPLAFLVMANLRRSRKSVNTPTRFM